ncbi:MAG: hypothetical protein C0483_10115 [Pirellula sp.]|nr:hypothetical protein [Pirellula sp.]
MGCASTQDFCYRQSHKCDAYWKSISTGNAPMLNCHYKDGWREGYFDYSTGRRCKPPTLPPKKYWSSCYEGCEGQKAISEWYAGYQKGMIEAEKRCGNCWHEIRPRSDCLPPGVRTDSMGETFTSYPSTVQQPISEPSPSLVPQNEAVPVEPVPVPVAPVVPVEPVKPTRATPTPVKPTPSKPTPSKPTPAKPTPVKPTSAKPMFEAPPQTSSDEPSSAPIFTSPPAE